MDEIDKALHELMAKGIVEAVSTCDWGGCHEVATVSITRHDETRPFCERHAHLSTGSLKLVDALPAGIDDPWQAGWAARANQAADDLADCASLNYERGFADASKKLPVFSTACVLLTLAAVIGFVAGAAMPR